MGADHLLPAVADDAPIVNREFDADNSVIKPMAAVGKTAAIPLRANRSSPRDYDRQRYGARNLIENFNPGSPPARRQRRLAQLTTGPVQSPRELTNTFTPPAL